MANRKQNADVDEYLERKAIAKSHTHLQFAPATALPKIAKEYGFADSKQNIMKEVRVLTAAMRQAGNPSSVDRLRIREMSVFKRTIPGKSPARSHSRETLVASVTDIVNVSNNFKTQYHE